MNAMNVIQRLWESLPCVALAGAYAPLLVEHAFRLLASPTYGAAILVLLFVAWQWSKLDDAKASQSRIEYPTATSGSSLSRQNLQTGQAEPDTGVGSVQAEFQSSRSGVGPGSPEVAQRQPRQSSKSPRVRTCLETGRAVWHIGGSWPAAVLLTLGILSWSPWLAAFSSITLVAGVPLWGRVATLVAALPHRWLLWLLLPLPLRMDQTLSFQLQLTSSTLCSYALDRLGINHLLTGNVFDLPDHRYWVDEACSGIRSLYAGICVVACWTCLRRFRRHRVIALMLTSIWWLTVMNGVRLLVTIVGQSGFGFPLVASPWHELAGAICFVVALGLIWSTDRMLGELWLRLIGPEDRADHSVYFEESHRRRDAGKHIRQASTHQWLSALVWCGLAGACLAQTVSSNAQACELTGTEDRLRDGSGIEAATVAERAFEVVGWSLTPVRQSAVDGTAHNWRRPRESAWEVRSRKGTAIGWWLLSGPFRDVHDVETCYRARGWKMTRRERRTGPGPDLVFSLLLLERESERRALVFHALWDPEGQLQHSGRSSDSLMSIWRSLSARMSFSGWARRPDRQLTQGVLFIDISATSADPLQLAAFFETLFVQCLERSRSRSG